MSNSIAAKFIQFIEPRLNRRSVAFVACLLLSGLFWLLTSLSREYVDEIELPIVYNDLPEDLIVVNEPVSHATAEVRGFGFDLLWHLFNVQQVAIPISIDPSNLPSLKRDGEEWHYVLTDMKNESMAGMKGQQMEILGISPDTIFIKVKPKYLKLVPIRLNAEISFSKQFGMTTHPVLVPDSILLIGPKDAIDTISFVRTQAQSWIGLNESVTADVQLIGFQDMPYLHMDRTSTRVELNVVEFTEGTVTIPLTINADDPSSVKVFPNEVDIKYLVPLSDYDSVFPALFQASVILDDEVRNLSQLVVNIDRYPEFVKQVRVTPAQVEFIVQE
ncbi:MAG: hypothetical protein K9J17_04270 [Flavobacteriales bacterium]|nr:hypothetical protein [Flavobacteriales bacterium]